MINVRPEERNTAGGLVGDGELVAVGKPVAAGEPVAAGARIVADVLVVGGGTAGCTAAIAAAEEGARVVLLEQDYGLGGAGVRAGVHLYWYGSCGGLQDEIDRLTTETEQLFGSPIVGFHPDAKRAVLSRLVIERGVDVRLGAAVYEVLQEDGRVLGVRALSDQGLIEVRAAVTVDASGDADVAAAAGGAWASGRAEDGVAHCYSLIPRVVMRDGKVYHLNFDGGWVDTEDPWDVSRAYGQGRQHIFDLLTDEEASTFAYMFAVAPQIGVRESRRIAGDYTVTFDDLLNNRRFADTVSCCYTHYDNHAADLGNESLASQIYTMVMSLNRHSLRAAVPFRAMLPAGLDGVIVAGRPISMERDAAMGIRMQRDMHKLGDAAGVAAALCAQSGVNPRQLDVARLQRRLLERGVLKPEELELAAAPNLRMRDRRAVRGDGIGNAGGDGGRDGSNAMIGAGGKAGPGGGLAAEGTAESDGQMRLDALIAALRDEHDKEFGVALLQLWRLGPVAAAAPLMELLRDERQPCKPGAVYGLALLRHEAAVPHLLDMLATRDDAVMNATKKGPRWVTGLILLRHMRSTAALEESLTILHEPHDPRIYTYALRYLQDIAALLSPEQRQRTGDSILSWLRLALPDRGLELHGGRRADFRWSLELQAAALLSSLGMQREAERLCLPHLNAQEAYVRKAADITLRWHMPAGKDDGLCSL